MVARSAPANGRIIIEMAAWSAEVARVALSARTQQSLGVNPDSDGTVAVRSAGREKVTDLSRGGIRDLSTSRAYRSRPSVVRRIYMLQRGVVSPGFSRDRSGCAIVGRLTVK